jgi:predicted nucleotide-binding protein (sugar kinase/HSP70/actin superfamily)
MLPTLQEWINYIAHERRALCWQSTQLLSLLKEWIGELVARWAESRVARIFEGAIQHMPREEPSSRVIELGSRYLDPSVKGEAILSMGRAVEYARHGLNGVVNVAPFGCMPGALVNGLLEEFRGEYDGIPVLKLAFDGVEQTAEDTLLEAFVHQALQHKGSRSAGESPGAAANTS